MLSKKSVQPNDVLTITKLPTHGHWSQPPGVWFYPTNKNPSWNHKRAAIKGEKLIVLDFPRNRMGITCLVVQDVNAERYNVLWVSIRSACVKTGVAT